MRGLLNLALVMVLSGFAVGVSAAAAEPDLGTLLRQFEEYSGARLVFDRSALPPGRYHDILQPLQEWRKPKAAAICLAEVHKFPRGYFGDVGLQAIAVFAACASKRGDGFRPYDKQLGGPGPSHRATLQALTRFDAKAIPPQQAAELVRLAAEVTAELLRHRIRPDIGQQRFVIWGREDKDGVNWTLRGDINQFGNDAARLKKIAMLDNRQSDLLARTQLKNLRLLARYYAYIASGWTVTPGTRKVFESARDTLCGSLPVAQTSLTKALRETDLLELGRRISKDGQPRLQASPGSEDG